MRSKGNFVNAKLLKFNYQSGIMVQGKSFGKIQKNVLKNLITRGKFRFTRRHGYFTALQQFLQDWNFPKGEASKIILSRLKSARNRLSKEFRNLRFS